MNVVAEEFDLTVRSHCLHTQRFGSPSAPLIIGVHGLTANMKSFDFIGEQLANDAFQLVALDLRGRGQSETTPPGTYGWEKHALDVFAVADVLGVGRFSVIGQSMGGSIAMKAAELDAARLDAVVLVDVAGRVDPGVRPVIASVIDRVETVYSTVEAYLAAVKAQGLVGPWNEYWDRFHRYKVEDVDGGVRSCTSLEAVAEDRAYTATQHPYDRWQHLTMPTLLIYFDLKKSVRKWLVTSAFGLWGCSRFGRNEATMVPITFARDWSHRCCAPKLATNGHCGKRSSRSSF